jgi:hypothetical protein
VPNPALHPTAARILVFRQLAFFHRATAGELVVRRGHTRGHLGEPSRVGGIPHPCKGGLGHVCGPNLEDIFRRAAHQVDRILKGVQPRDLPVE